MPKTRYGYTNSRQGKRDTLDGLFVRSSWEHNYALILNFWRDQGLITRWEYEPEYFEFPISRGHRFYLPDFKVYYPDGRYEYHEVKGYMDAKSKTKLKRFAKYYPELTLALIDGPAYKALTKVYKELLPDWET